MVGRLGRRVGAAAESPDPEKVVPYLVTGGASAAWRWHLRGEGGLLGGGGGVSGPCVRLLLGSGRFSAAVGAWLCGCPGARPWWCGRCCGCCLWLPWRCDPARAGQDGGCSCGFSSLRLWTRRHDPLGSYRMESEFVVMGRGEIPAWLLPTSTTTGVMIFLKALESVVVVPLRLCLL
ncbi:hypothetical protein BRADI_2g38818v3 [Brachypodium distachyon]|uniref:Uncharacterized protein n=1 Tax=Brachypodium distachyon TaxID=15368 RepID=A0A0Q3R3C0_BRADI|nr:hypothetical protein BRADI_2g38818v3 [Brachypodium distachyon]